MDTNDYWSIHIYTPRGRALPNGDGNRKKRDTVGRDYPRKFAKPIEKGGKLWILMTFQK